MVTKEPRPGIAHLLLASGLRPAQIATLLAPYGFQDVKRADASIQQMAGDPRARASLAIFLGDLLTMVSETADPHQALVHWERYIEAGIHRVQLFDYLRGSPRMLHLLCSIFGNSPALAQTLIRDPLLVYWLAEEEVLNRRPSRNALADTLQEMLGHVVANELKLEALRRFKRREMLRIGVRDLLKLADVRETTAALSDLASVLIEAAYRVVEADLRRSYGRPMHPGPKGRHGETGFAVMALGKLGGMELNYSSDVDLIYVYEEEGHTVRGTPGDRIPGTTSVRRVPASRVDEMARGPDPTSKHPVTSEILSNAEYFEYLARDLTKALSEPTQEGYVFRVDLRLRAEGSLGRLARSIADYAQYYRTRGEEWERLALLKASPVAGSEAIGRKFLNSVRPFIFGRAARPDKEAALALVRDVKRIKDMIDDRMASRGHERRNVKLGTGGIREVEFLVQAVQVLCGGKLQGIRDRSTVGALARLGRHGLLSARETAALTEAYLFLRDVEHKLQLVHDLQTHALPDSAEELTRCAVRLGYSARNRREALRRFRKDYARHTAVVHRLFHGLFEAPQRSRLLKPLLTGSSTRRT
jgi:glutamate-ammonia-ligase adenylyltransferase